MKMDFSFIREKIKGKAKEEVYFIEKTYFVFMITLWVTIKILCLNLSQFNKDYPINYIFSSYFLIILSCGILAYVLKSRKSVRLNLLKQIIAVLNFIAESYLIIILSFDKKEDSGVLLRCTYTYILSNMVLGLFFMDLNIIVNIVQLLSTSIVLLLINNKFNIGIEFELFMNGLLYMIFYLFHLKNHLIYKKFLKKFNTNNELCNIYSAILPLQPLIMKLNISNTYSINKAAHNYFKKMRENDFVQLNMESQCHNENKVIFETIGLFNEGSKDYYAEYAKKEESEHQNILSFFSKLNCIEITTDSVLHNILRDKKNLFEVFSYLLESKEFEETDKLKCLGEFTYINNSTNFDIKNTSTFCPLKENIETNVPHFFRVYIRKENIDDQIYIHLLLNFIQKTEKKEEKDTIFDDFKQSIFQLIAHEFKTPVISILSSLERTNASEKEVEIPKLKQLFNYMIFLVNNLIEYATKNNIQLSFEEISVESLLEFGHEILQMILNYHEKNKKIKLKSRIDKKIRGLKVLSDKHRLLQIIFTLSSITIKNCRNGVITFQAVLGSDGNINVIFSSSCSHFNSLRLNKIDSSNDPRNLLYGLDLSQKIASLLGTEIKFSSDSLNKCRFSFDIKNNRKASLIYKTTKENSDESEKMILPTFIKQNLEKSFDESYFNSENSLSIDDSSENKDTIIKVKTNNRLEEIKEDSSSSRSEEQLSFVKIKIEDKELYKTKKKHKKEKNFQSKFMSKDTIKLKSQLFVRPPDSSNRCNSSNSCDASDKINTNSSLFPHSYPKPIRNKSTDAIINNFRTVEDMNLHQKFNKFFSTRGSFSKFKISKKTVHFPEKEELQSSENKMYLKNKLARRSSGENKRIHEIRYSIKQIEIFTILIIDDYRFCRGLLENIISQLIFPKYKGLVRIEQGNDGVCLLYKYINHLDDLENIIVFIDEDMEFMKGSEAVAQIRKWEKERNISRQIKITSITAFNDEMTRMKIKESGVDYVLNKPPKKSDINEIFESLGIYDKMQSIFLV